MSKSAIRTDEQSTFGVRERILQTASALFYKHGVRAVGVDLVTERAGVAKTSIYRHFGTKDALVAAFLEEEDRDFWSMWDRVSQEHPADPEAELDAQLAWIGQRVERSNYRGCPQINVAAEFPEDDHPARKVAADHKREMRSRLKGIALRLGADRPDELAIQLSMLINGAFVSAQLVSPGEAVRLLQRAAHALIGVSRK